MPCLVVSKGCMSMCICWLEALSELLQTHAVACGQCAASSLGSWLQEIHVWPGEFDVVGRYWASRLMLMLSRQNAGLQAVYEPCLHASMTIQSRLVNHAKEWGNTQVSGVNRTVVQAGMLQ